MKKEWYIFINASHIGPYSLAEMQVFHEKRDIKDNTLIWREGMHEWRPYNKVPEFSVLSDDLPPPIPVENTPLIGSIPKTSTIPSMLLPKDFKIKVEEPVIATSKLNSFKINPKLLLKILAALGLIVIACGAFIIHQTSSAPDLHIKGVSPFNREQLEHQITIDENTLSFASALSMDKGTLWVATNQKENLSVTIDLKSEPSRLLAPQDTEEVEVRLQGMIINHLGHFTSMRIMKGQSFYPGEYKVHIKGKKIHWINQFLKLNKHELNQEFTYDFKCLIYSGNTKEFERKLLERKVDKVNKLLKPWQEKLESFGTLRSLLDKTMEIFIINIEKAHDGKSFSGFEKNYIEDVSPILQSLVFASTTDLDKDAEFKIYNEAIVEIGKKIGAFASEIITQMSGLKKIDLKMKTKQREHFQGKSEDISQLIKNNTSIIENKIKDFQATVK